MKDLLLILLPGAMYFWVLFVGQAPLQEIVREQESHVLPRLLACPVTPIHYLAAKLLRCFLLCGLAITLLLGVSAWVFQVRWGNPLQVAFTVAAWAGSMTGLLACVYGIARTREQANILGPAVLMGCAMLGGSMFPFENLPAILQMLGRFTPNRWGVLVLQGTAHARSLGELWLPFVELWALAGLGSLAGMLLFRRRLTEVKR